MPRLVVDGGRPLQPKALPPYISVGAEEEAAAVRVMRTGRLSQFVAAGDKRFYGGPEVRGFEAAVGSLIGVEHAASFNSATSGLVAAVGALDLGPGDEVIVPAQTMSASAAAVLAYRAIPIFADVDPLTYCLDPVSVRKRISSQTKALVIVHLYGHPANMDELLGIAREHDLRVIEDCAQSPLAVYKGRQTGSFGDISVFSLNLHKHINTGEGGVALTANAELFERLCSIRNHGEVKGSAGNLSNTIGWNFRLTELQAAIGTEQVRKLPAIVERKRLVAAQLTDRLDGFEWLQPATVNDGCTHSYYDFPIHFDLAKIGMDKSELMRITAAENLPITESYKPLYWQQIYQKMQCYGKHGEPFDRMSEVNRDNYLPGSCPVAELAYAAECLTFEICSYDVTEAHTDLIAEMFRRIESRST